MFTVYNFIKEIWQPNDSIVCSCNHQYCCDMIEQKKRCLALDLVAGVHSDVGQIRLASGVGVFVFVCRRRWYRVSARFSESNGSAIDWMPLGYAVVFNTYALSLYMCRICADSIAWARGADGGMRNFRLLTHPSFLRASINIISNCISISYQWIKYPWEFEPFSNNVNFLCSLSFSDLNSERSIIIILQQHANTYMHRNLIASSYHVDCSPRHR